MVDNVGLVRALACNGLQPDENPQYVGESLFLGF